MRKIIALSFIAACIFYCNSVIAQSHQVLIKALDGTTLLNGGSVVPGHTGEIDGLSFSQGESGCPSGTTGCQTSTSEFNFMMSINPASVLFKKLLYNGTKLTSVDVYMIKPGTTAFTYYKIRMEDVTITSVQESASSEYPTFAISLSPSRIAWQQRKQRADGSGGDKTTYGWDVQSNAEWNYVFP
ncbi:type VI secretion system tube protein Hcp [Panacibacter ginsenosidivorans]|uniref:Type VI secretion system tube protein Hcp n=1 Tax=Panacibacter ginsenosidivorans TaxID=1813871 RepID=A0A5B8VEI7_9BACT|nr:type VI secretion system tube protein Hcp [Panacibacter ginsenosidivorans]QEC69840.1 type VI secretion system tube protein Hcp [Panacibacter ginsenosidivorans]